MRLIPRLRCCVPLPMRWMRLTKEQKAVYDLGVSDNPDDRELGYNLCVGNNDLFPGLITAYANRAHIHVCEVVIYDFSEVDHHERSVAVDIKSLIGERDSVQSLPLSLVGDYSATMKRLREFRAWCLDLNTDYRQEIEVVDETQ